MKGVPNPSNLLELLGVLVVIFLMLFMGGGTKPDVLPRATSQATLVPTLEPTSQPTIEPSLSPESTLAPTPTAERLYRQVGYVVVTANARRCPALKCGVVRVLRPGQLLGVDKVVAGEVIANEGRWIVARLNGQIVYVHWSVVRVEDE